MSLLKSIAARTSAALRKLAAKAQPSAKLPEVSQAAPAAPADAAKKYRIAVRGADGELVSKLVTREEFDAYIGNDRTWRRIA